MKKTVNFSRQLAFTVIKRCQFYNQMNTKKNFVIKQKFFAFFVSNKCKFRHIINIKKLVLNNKKNARFVKLSMW